MMPNWNEVLQEMLSAQGRSEPDPIGLVRRKYLTLLKQKTGRNIITYYSGWLQKPQIMGVDINDEDKNGFMTAVHGMDCSLGLDLVMHTPGGSVSATESIVDYLYRKFRIEGYEDIRVIIPQLAMSAGTMIACSSNRILMGKQSSLGPVDPHLSNIPAQGVIEEFKRAYKEIKKDPNKLAVWRFILEKYQPTFLSKCENAINLAEEFVGKNLETVMFSGGRNAKAKAKKVVKYLTNYKDRKGHDRHINIDDAISIGLIVEKLEDDQELQDLVLTLHHCYMHTLANTPILKIIENHNGQAVVKNLA